MNEEWSQWLVRKGAKKKKKACVLLWKSSLYLIFSISNAKSIRFYLWRVKDEWAHARKCLEKAEYVGLLCMSCNALGWRRRVLEGTVAIQLIEVLNGREITMDSLRGTWMYVGSSNPWLECLYYVWVIHVPTIMSAMIFLAFVFCFFFFLFYKCL